MKDEAIEAAWAEPKVNSRMQMVSRLHSWSFLMAYASSDSDQTTGRRTWMVLCEVGKI
jgi:hypothetical protein